MHIAQIAPLFESVPPKLYGGTERVVSYLTEELVRRGHEVTLFASGDSQTSAHLVAPCPKALRLDPSCQDEIVHHVTMLEQVRKLARRFDVLHFHLEYLHLPVARSQPTPHLTTAHGRLDLLELMSLYREVAGAPLVSISDAQRRPMPWCNWIGTVWHGLTDEHFEVGESAGDYLVFLGRISPEKRLDRAIEIARRAGMPLKVAAKVAAKDRLYYESLAASLAEPFVEYLGEVTQRDKLALLGGARALLFPIDWPEPFGLVTVESMARGTPVIGWRCGSVPEIIEPGVTGFIVESIEEAVAAVARVGEIDRRICATRARERFSVERMTDAYLDLYGRLARLHRTAAPAAAAPAA